MPATPQHWFLQFTSPNVYAATGNGRPWADGTEMACRATSGADPWDSGCAVNTYVGGFEAMSAIRDELETVIANASVSQLPVGQRGHVYIAGWRFNCLRDLSDMNPWGTNPWAPGNQANPDQTAMGLVVRLLQAGVMVRMLLWLPTGVQAQALGAAHAEDHFLAARIVQFESNRLAPGAPDPLGVVALDLRTAGTMLPAATHHQKMMVIRSLGTDVAFVGGVDLAYTRRSAPALSGDWQSAQTIPNPANWWPQQAAGVNYGFQGQVPAMASTQSADLPANVYGSSSPAGDRQMWHDQHLKLEGPIVATIERQFAERWADQASRLCDLTDPGNLTSDQVIFSTSGAYAGSQIHPLPLGAVIQPLPGMATQVQMWRTIPLRPRGAGAPLFRRGEFTVMAGIARAVGQAAELIWMFDQYFWSEPLARLLNARLQANAQLHVILILPPYADTAEGVAHLARRNALQVLTNGVQARVGVYNMWYRQPAGANLGIYVHAKSHTYDNSLLVCGSANLNRRSFLCDTELACAVLDRQEVGAHQQRLWSLLFPNSPWPALDLDVAGNGAQFFASFQQAATAALNAGDYRLIEDPWAQKPARLPNHVDRPVDLFLGPIYDTVYDPSSVMLSIETFPDPTKWIGGRPGGLDEIVARLEAEPGPKGDWPFRRW